MNVLIVDDEQHAREAAKLLVPWERFGVSELLEAENGEEAKAIIKLKRPSIIVTDMHMPVADGMKLIEWVTRFDPAAKLIVISGYNDFSYVRHTLRHGGIDYLLKPVDPAQLQDAVKRALDLLAEERQEKQRQIEQGITMNQYKPVYRDHLLSQLVQSRAADAEPAVRQLREQFPKLADAAECRIALFPLRWLMNKLLQRFSGDRDLAVYAIQNVLNDLVMLEWNEGCAFRCPNEPEQLAVLLWAGDDRCVHRRVMQLVDALRSTFSLPFYAAVSGARPFPSCAIEAFEAARRTLMQRNLLNVSEAAVLTESACAAAQGEPSPLPDLTPLAETIRLAMLARDEFTLRKTVDAWFDSVREMPAITPLHIARWQKQLDVIAGQWQHRLSTDEHAGDTAPHLPLPFLYNEDGSLSLERTQERWSSLLVEEAERLARLIRQERNIIHEMTAYIERHLQEDLSLQQLASRFFLSREYVSRKFRQETGVTLSEYVERLRMEKATRLLANRTYKIADIAAMVGYADEKYFSKVFKKHTGLSPQQHRKSET